MWSPLRFPRFTKVLAGGALLAGAGLSAPEAGAGNWVSEMYRGEDAVGAKADMSLLVGQRSLKSNDWKPVEKQAQVGFDADYDGGDWPVSLCGSFLFSTASGSTSGVEVTARTYELQLGLRKIWWPLKRVRPYLDAGGSMLWASYKVDGGGLRIGSDTQYGFGYWAGAGAFVRVGRSWQVGADARWSQVNLDVSNSGANAGGLQLGVMAGYHWSE